MTIDQIRQESWDRSIHALGTSYVFEQKSKFYKKWLKVNTILGIVVPVLLGATVATYGQSSNILTIVLLVAGPVSIFHAVLSAISLGNRWDDKLASTIEAQSGNRTIADEYERLAKYPPSELTVAERTYEVIRARDEAQIKQDEKFTFSEKEKRIGMRYALWIRKRACATCNTVPVSMTATDCDTCGKF